MGWSYDVYLIVGWEVDWDDDDDDLPEPLELVRTYWFGEDNRTFIALTQQCGDGITTLSMDQVNDKPSMTDKARAYLLSLGLDPDEPRVYSVICIT
jgi:hypothetical protein